MQRITEARCGRLRINGAATISRTSAGSMLLVSEHPPRHFSSELPLAALRPSMDVNKQLGQNLTPAPVVVRSISVPEAPLPAIAALDSELFERLLPQVFAGEAPDPELLQALALTCHTPQQYGRVISAFREARSRPKVGFSIAVFEAQILLTLSGRFARVVDDALAVFTAATRSRGDVVFPAIEGCKGLMLRQCRSLEDVAMVMKAVDDAVKGGGGSRGNAWRTTPASQEKSRDNESLEVEYLLEPSHLQPALQDLLLNAGRGDLACSLLEKAAKRYQRGGGGAPGTRVGDSDDKDSFTQQLLSWVRTTVTEPAAAAYQAYLSEPAPWERSVLGRFLPLFESHGLADSVRAGKHKLVSPLAGGSLRQPLVKFIARMLLLNAAKTSNDDEAVAAVEKALLALFPDAAGSFSATSRQRYKLGKGKDGANYFSKSQHVLLLATMAEEAALLSPSSSPSSSSSSSSSSSTSSPLADRLLLEAEKRALQGGDGDERGTSWISPGAKEALLRARLAVHHGGNTGAAPLLFEASAGTGVALLTALQHRLSVIAAAPDASLETGKAAFVDVIDAVRALKKGRGGRRDDDGGVAEGSDDATTAWLSEAESGLFLASAFALTQRFPSLERWAVEQLCLELASAAPAVTDTTDTTTATMIHSDDSSSGPAVFAADGMPPTRPSSSFRPLSSVYGDSSLLTLRELLTTTRGRGTHVTAPSRFAPILEDPFSHLPFFAANGKPYRPAFGSSIVIPPALRDKSQAKQAQAQGRADQGDYVPPGLRGKSLKPKGNEQSQLAATTSGHAKEATANDPKRPSSSSPSSLFDRVEIFDPTVLDDSMDADLVFEARTRLRMYCGGIIRGNGSTTSGGSGGGSLGGPPSIVGRLQGVEYPDPLAEACNNTNSLAQDGLTLKTLALLASSPSSSPSAVDLLFGCSSLALFELAVAVLRLVRSGSLSTRDAEDLAAQARNLLAGSAATTVTAEETRAAGFLLNVALGRRSGGEGGGGSSSAPPSASSASSSGGAPGGSGSSSHARGVASAASSSTDASERSGVAALFRCLEANALVTRASVVFAVQGLLRATEEEAEDSLGATSLATAADILLRHSPHSLGSTALDTPIDKEEEVEAALDRAIVARVASLCAAEALKAAAFNTAKVPLLPSEGLAEPSTAVKLHADPSASLSLCVEEGDPLSWSARAGSLLTLLLPHRATALAAPPMAVVCVPAGAPSASRVLAAASDAVMKGKEGVAASDRWASFPLTLTAAPGASKTTTTISSGVVDGALSGHVISALLATGQPLAAAWVAERTDASVLPPQVAARLVAELSAAGMFLDALSVYRRCRGESRRADGSSSSIAAAKAEALAWSRAKAALVESGAALIRDLSTLNGRLARRIQQSLLSATGVLQEVRAAAASAASREGADGNAEATTADSLPPLVATGLELERTCDPRSSHQQVAASSSSLGALLLDSSTSSSVSPAAPASAAAAATGLSSDPLRFVAYSFEEEQRPSPVSEARLRCPNLHAWPASASASSSSLRFPLPSQAVAGRIVGEAPLFSALFKHPHILGAASALFPADPLAPSSSSSSLSGQCLPQAIAFRYSATGKTLFSRVISQAGAGPCHAHAAAASTTAAGAGQQKPQQEQEIQASVAWAFKARAAISSVSASIAADLDGLMKGSEKEEEEEEAEPNSSNGSGSQRHFFLKAVVILADAASNPSKALKAFATHLPKAFGKNAERWNALCGGGGNDGSLSVASPAVTEELILMLCRQVGDGSNSKARGNGNTPFHKWLQFHATAEAVADKAARSSPSNEQATDDPRVDPFPALARTQQVLSALEGFLGKGKAADDALEDTEDSSGGSLGQPGPSPFPRRPLLPSPLPLTSAGATASVQVAREGRPIVVVPSSVKRYLLRAAEALESSQDQRASHLHLLLDVAETLHGLLRANNCPVSPTTVQALLAAQSRMLRVGGGDRERREVEPSAALKEGLPNARADQMEREREREMALARGMARGMAATYAWLRQSGDLPLTAAAVQESSGSGGGGGCGSQ